MSKAADRAARRAAKAHAVDENGRRRNAARRARALAEKKSDAMPVAAPLDGPRGVRVVDAELVDPSPRGGIAEVFQQRYLLRLIVGRQLAAQYAASVLGLLWSYIQPAMRFGVYFFVFGVVLSAHKSTPNFALHLFAGMVFVHYFSETWSGGTRSVRSNRALLLKMRMPREIFPVAAMVTAMYHTGPQILILTVFCVIAGWHLTFTAVAAGVLGLLILLTFAMSMALFFSALNVYYKDFQNIVSTFTQFLHFMVPMMYSYSFIAKLGDNHPWIYQLYMANPLAESVLLMQRFFWYPTLDDPEKYTNEFPPDLFERGFIMLGICLVLLYLAQKFFSRLESRFPERL
ncbi:ABC transporter [Nocardioides marmoriginsengisoli]|uniref:Transport permease protein n=1 Tax=Nocardioides marmoriginsengisoli TaxID=661483 RepID=A0A3N0CHS6_9ACTN|nr:ABC transporter permease [Nocardioides marmoriginsengisoli]RNL63037.1 ABC transporter [Nocardioides marmoriginsengisoli]